MPQGKPRKSAKRGEFKTGDRAFRAVVFKRNRRSIWTVATKPFKGAHFATFPPDLIRPCILAGSPMKGCILDPFFGAGTTGVVAIEEGRQYLGIELNSKYIALAERRIHEVQPPLSLCVS